MKSSSFNGRASTDASTTSSTGPRSSYSLPSSFTPFYPRSQQLQQYCYSDQTSPSKKDLNNASDTYLQETSNRYSHSNYASTGSESFEVSWFPEVFYGENNWNCFGTGWQYGDSSYVDDSAYQTIPCGGESTFISSKNASLSGPPSILPQAFMVGSSTYKGNTSLPVRDGYRSNKKEVIVSYQRNHQEKFGEMNSECKVKSFEKQVAAIGLKHELPKGFSFGNLISKPSFSKVSAETSSIDDDRRAKEEVSKNEGKCSFQTQNSDINNHKYKSQVGNNICIKDAVNISSNSQNSCNSLKDARCTSPSTSSKSLPNVKGLADPVTKENHSVKCKNASLLDLSDAGNQKILSTESKTCQPSVEDIHTMVMNHRTVDATSVHENIGLDNSQAMLGLDGYQLVMKSIYNLSKVIFRSKSGYINRGSGQSDLAMEKSIYMLSLSLLQKMHTNENENAMLEINQESLEDDFGTNVSKDDLDAQSILSFLHQGTMPPQFETSLSRKIQGDEVHKTIPTIHAKFNLEDDNASIKQQISEMRSNLMQLQDDIAYERSESNVTVSMYKKLWNEARNELEASKLQILKINAEVEGIKKEFQKPKDTDSSHIKCHTSYCKKPEDVERAEISGEDLIIKGNTVHTERVRSTKVVRSDIMMTEDMDAPMNKAYLDKENSNDPHITALLKKGDAIEYPKNLQTDIAHRFSILLARPKLGINMSCSDEDEPLSDCNDSSECSVYAMKGNQSMVSRDNAVVEKIPSWNGTSYYALGNTNAKYPMNCDSQEDWDSEADEVEIICLRPGDLDKQVICLKGESEWEHVEAGGKHS